MFKNEPLDPNAGFYRTPAGQELKGVAQKWNERIYGDPDIADGIDFKLNTTLKPFEEAVTITEPGG